MNVLVLGVGLPAVGTRFCKPGEDQKKKALEDRLDKGPEKQTLDRYLNKVDFVYLAATKDSRELANALQKKWIPQEKQHEIVVVDVNDIKKIYEKIRKLERLREAKKIIFDITGGTKAMAAGISLAAIEFNNPIICYETGPRGHDGLVKTTEYAVEMSAAEALRIKLIDEFFKVGNYSACLEIIEKTKLSEQKRNLLTSYVEIFYYWDLFDHKNALRNLKNFLKNIGYTENGAIHDAVKKLKKNEKILEKINSKEGINRAIYLALDIYYNALRRERDKKYDDAVARLYRFAEAVAQIRLERTYLIKANNVNIENEYIKKIGEENLAYLNSKKRDDNKIRLALQDCYWLLNVLNDDKYGHLRDKLCTLSGKSDSPLNLRNNSILAHGFDSIDETKYNEIKRFVESEIFSIFKEENDIKEQISFPNSINFI